MPAIQQLWVDPATGATFPVSYVVVVFAAVDLHAFQGHITAKRYSGITAYSTGLQPIVTYDLDLSGSTFQFTIGPAAQAANTTYGGSLITAAHTYISGLPIFSGGIQQP